MDKKAVVFALAALLLLTTVILTISRNESQDWVGYQRKYFAQQIDSLQAKLKTAKDQKVRKRLVAEINRWKSRQPAIVNLVLPNGKVERCKTCHLGIEEISPSHPEQSFGCTVCHGGNGLSLDLQTAHANWRGQGHPGSLVAASLSCGGKAPDGTTCHSGNPREADNQVELVQTSIMSTKAGELNYVRRMFGVGGSGPEVNLSPGQTAAQIPQPLGGRPKEDVFKQNCLTKCHQDGGSLPLFALPRSKDTVTSGNAVLKGKVAANGCEACHVLTNPTHTYQGTDATIPKDEMGHGLTHRLTTQIPYTQCNQCHNQGLHDPVQMRFTPRADSQKVVNDWAQAQDTWADRVKNYYVPGEVFTRCEVSLDCIDCHTRQEVMGDGHLYNSEYDAVKIQCMDCHGTIKNQPLTKRITDKNDLAFEEQITNPVFPPLHLGDEILLTHKGEELPFLRHQGNSWFLVSRVTGKSFNIPLVQGSGCQQNPEEQGADACHKCHDISKHKP